MTSQPGSGRMGRTVLTCHSLPTPRFRYSPAVRGAGCIFVSGLVGLHPATGLLADGDHAQTRQVLENFRALCDEHGWSPEQLLQARVYCAAEASADEVNRAWDDAFADVQPPARTFVTVHALPLGAAVEIEFVLLDAPSRQDL